MLSIVSTQFRHEALTDACLIHTCVFAGLSNDIQHSSVIPYPYPLLGVAVFVGVNIFILRKCSRTRMLRSIYYCVKFVVVAFCELSLLTFIPKPRGCKFTFENCF